MRRLKVCRVCEQFPPLKGGLSSGMFDLSMAQNDLGYDITVVTRQGDGDFNFDSTVPFRIIRIRARNTLEFGFKAHQKIKELPYRPDVVHTHGPAAFGCLLKRNNTDPPLVHSVHAVRKYQYDLYRSLLKIQRTTGYPSSWRYSWLNPHIAEEFFMEKWIFRKAKHLALVADFFRKQLRKFYNIESDRMTTVFNGSSFNDVKFKKINKRQPDHNIPNPTYLFVGRFDWHKRVDLLIGAMKLIVAEMPMARLIVVGNGEMEHIYKDMVRKRMLESNIFFPGWISKEALAKHYKKAHCICLPSISEGLPKVLLEAMSLQVPIISADNYSSSELLRNGIYGLIVRDATEEGWSIAMANAIRNRADHVEMAEKALSYFKKNYHWSHVAKRMEILYQSII